jgi:hypothetical protein
MRIDKRASIGIGTLITMIIAIIFIAAVALSFFYPAQFAGFFKSFLPSGGDNPEYGTDIINGTDEEIPFSEGGKLIYVGSIGDWRDGSTPVYHDKDPESKKNTLILVGCGIDGGKWKDGSVNSLITIERYSNAWVTLTNAGAQDKKKIVIKMNGFIIGGVSSYGQIYLVYNEQLFIKSFFKNIGWMDFAQSKLLDCNVRPENFIGPLENFQLVLSQVKPAFYIGNDPATIKTNLVIKDYKTFAASLGVKI